MFWFWWWHNWEWHLNKQTVKSYISVFIASENVADKKQLNTLDVSEENEVYKFAEHKISSELCDIILEKWRLHQW